ncbi:MAG TPA: hypothetical protein PK293_09915 [Spirochaetota bacterium]|nr:hypothetical protein [Spirochaetota bacterium]HPF06339.1 hypothetical protein [Spirochaetota bacterium]HPJ43066.1 hypothetical protein [Spirochaetota bacterium]HPR37891.1 hypothetical protein [Spirochaetota bacterium]
MKHRTTNRLLGTIMKARNNAIYRLIYRFPRFFVSLLILFAIIILYFFVSFVMKYVVVFK